VTGSFPRFDFVRVATDRDVARKNHPAALQPLFSSETQYRPCVAMTPEDEPLTIANEAGDEEKQSRRRASRLFLGEHDTDFILAIFCQKGIIAA
jgi:hypothetical protein